MGRVLAVDDEKNVLFTLTEVLEDRGHEVITEGRARDALARLDEADVLLTDLRMPEMDGLALLAEASRRAPGLPVLMLTARGTERDAVRAMKQGAFDYLTKPFDADELVLAIERALEVGALRRGARRAEAERALGTPIVGDAPALRRVVDAALRVAPRDVPVLVTGETGTGKELLASLLHAGGPRREGPLVRFNCAAIPGELAEAELFGHTKGAFTGASQARQGYFAKAHGGTLVLDEIGEMDPSLQAKVLRAVQEGEIQSVGSSAPTKVNVRVVACTHRDLAADARTGRFREDLYYRLAVIELRMPPLRERREDVPALARTFAARYAERFGLDGVVLDEPLVAALCARPWPGNVRELENVVARLLALSEGGVVGLDALGGEPTSKPTPSGGLRAQVDAFEREVLERVLAECEGNQSEAARRLQISRTTLLDKLKKHARD
ncbi:MAG: sigma-54-dependent Fis family transcriptional regulator [Sandaracinus sp.]|nr:sigma-54-dependent Fis family transcriptional regulator [Sandaracinus sp.]MCB9613247.1 sigma-54-dependent Fis family transcriptional regulator [Sandaracinus sp.]